MNGKTKYYIRRIVTMFLIASPCYIWSQTLVWLGFDDNKLIKSFKRKQQSGDSA